MSSPGRAPRTFVDEPHLFGQTRHLTWRITEDEAGRAQAQLHNEAAIAIREAVRITYPGRSGLRTYARVTQRNYGQLLRVLRGEATMALRDLADARRYLNLNIALTPPGRQPPPRENDRAHDDVIERITRAFETTDITKALHAEGIAAIHQTDDGTIVTHHPDGRIMNLEGTDDRSQS